MTDREVAGYINRGANYYVGLLGRAEHMERIDRAFYSLIRPKGDVHGVRFVFNVRLDGLPPEERRALVTEIQGLDMPVWLDLGSAYGVGEGDASPREPSPEDEVYLAMLPKGQPAYSASDGTVEVRTPQEFAQWAGVVNRVLSGGREDVHPRYHYPLCRDGLLRCYMARGRNGEAVSVAAGAVDREAVSLELVATLPEYRRQGLARTVCHRAVAEAFSAGARIVTVRAADGTAAALYRSLGFSAYGA